MRVQIVLLCEDEQLACFGRRFLKSLGYKPYQLREEKPSPGRGSAEQWVRMRMPRELKAMRDANSSALIVMTDADSMTVDQRSETLRKQCAREDVEWRRPDEAVLLVIPKRNIETWLAYLRGEDANENVSYPKYAAESDCREEVRNLIDMCERGRLRSPAPSSLTIACDEWQRLRK